MTSREEFLAEHHRIVDAYPEFTRGLDNYLLHPIKTRKNRDTFEAAASLLSPHELHFVLSQLIEIDDYRRGQLLIAVAVVASGRKSDGDTAEVFHTQRTATQYQIVGQEALYGFATNTSKI